MNRFGALIEALRDHESLLELALAAFALAIALIRALTLLLLAVGAVYVAMFHA